MKAAFRSLYRRLLEAYGPQHWWPADDPFEMMLGAILIQHTAWANASRAIENLRSVGLLAPGPVDGTGLGRLAALIRPAGVYRVKARRIRAFARWYRSSGEYAALRALPTPALRRSLLSVHGIGPETADDILVYAFDRPVFVVDAYARRLFARYGLARGDEKYPDLKARVEAGFHRDAAALGELHALIVEHGKRKCRPKPLCGACCLRSSCAQVLNFSQ
ncbi:MAG: endonuclease [Gammaproteobacteria bacterium]|nr:endonuclease [Gammaproteobacteria bacterium]